MIRFLQTVLPRLDLLLRWLLACMLGSGVGLGLGWLLTAGLSRSSLFNPDRGFIFALFVSLGLALGLFQGTMMVDVLPGKYRWLLATMGGYCLASLIMAVEKPLVLPTSNTLDNALRLGLGGACIGLAQWFALRKMYHQAWQWIIANSIGYQAFLWMATNPPGSFGELFMTGLMVGTLAAFIPGVTLTWLHVRLLETETAPFSEP